MCQRKGEFGNKPIRVCMISGSYPPIQDGVGIGAQILLRKINSQDEDITVFLLTSQEVQGEELVYPIIRKWNWFSLPLIIKFIKLYKPNIIHIQYPTVKYGRHPMINFLPLFLKLLMKDIRIIASIHEYVGYTVLGRLRIYPLAKWSDWIITADERNRRELEQRFGKKVRCIPMGNQIYLEPNKNYIRQHKRKKEIFVFSYWGFIRKNKGVDVLLTAFSRVVRLSKQRKVKLIILANLSNKDKYHQVLNRLIREKELDEWVEVLGYQPKELLTNYLLQSDCCVLPFTDGVTERRGTFIAAMQLGIPVITTRGKFLPEGLVNKGNVMLVQPNDAKMLSRVMLEIMHDDRLRDKLSRNCKIWGQRFSWDAIVQKLIETYKEVVFEDTTA